MSSEDLDEIEYGSNYSAKKEIVSKDEDPNIGITELLEKRKEALKKKEEELKKNNANK